MILVFPLLMGALTVWAVFIWNRAHPPTTSSASSLRLKRELDQMLADRPHYVVRSADDVHNQGDQP